MGLMTALLNQAAMFAAQLGYAAALRGLLARQSRTLRERPVKCFAVGFAATAFFLLLVYLSFLLAAANGSAVLLALLTVPFVLALSVAGAVSLATIGAVVFSWDVEETPFRCLAVGQIPAVVAGAVPLGGPLLVTLYVSAGLGAMMLTPLEPAEDLESLRANGVGLLALLVLTLALGVGLYRAKDRLENNGMAKPAVGVDWSSSSQGQPK